MRTVVCFLLILSFLGTTTAAQEVVVKEIASNLKNPCGIAIRPTTEDVYVADTGRGRIIHVDGSLITEIIDEFPVEPFELDSTLKLGPMALMFRKRNHLIVGTGGASDGEDSISVYNIEEIGKEPVKAEDFEYQVKLDADGDQPAEGDFFSIAKSKLYLYASCNGNAKKGWVAQSKLLVNDFGELRRFVPTVEKARVPGPGGMAISPDGHLVVGQMGTRDKSGDSILTFYSEGGELLDKFPTGLNDIVALAYSPRKKILYALDFNWAEPKNGGLYKLLAVDSVAGCEAELIQKFERPTAMAFNKKGELYVTVCGIDDSTTEEDDEFSAPGKCFLVKGAD